MIMKAITAEAVQGCDNAGFRHFWMLASETVEQFNELAAASRGEISPRGSYFATRWRHPETGKFPHLP
jgi:hypothetical protein